MRSTPDGDHAATEEDIFEAAEKTILEVTDLVKHVVNSLNGNQVVHHCRPRFPIY